MSESQSPLDNENVCPTELEPVAGWNRCEQAVGFGQRLSRVFSLVRYHRCSQIFWRVAKLVRMKFLRVNRYAVDSALIERFSSERFSSERLSAETFSVRLDSLGWGTISQRRLAAHCVKKNQRLKNGERACADFTRGQFRFLNQDATFSLPLDWQSVGNELPALWRFHFHYHEFLLDAVASAELLSTEPVETENIASVWNFISEWIDGNALTDAGQIGNAWHPFCISRRLPVWLTLWQICCPPVSQQSKILESIFQQAQVLSQHLEWDLGGNHLFENIRGLAFAAAFFHDEEAVQEESAEWLKQVRDLLPGQLTEQILPSGEHYERSPMYHAMMLEAVLDIRDLLEPIDLELSQQCEWVANNMALFLRAILHPDGEIPLLGDSAHGESADPLILIDAALNGGERLSEKQNSEEPCQHGAVAIGDYWVWSEENQSRLIFDAGNVAVDELPAHGHCDLLNVEASVGGERFIVDSGVFNYESDEWRQYCRSTAAHNVLQIDDAEQCDIWSRFRMGRRGHITETAAGEWNGFSWMRASHNAYRHLGVPTVTRWVACQPKGPWLIIDRAVGTQQHRLTNRLHLHPNAVVTSVDKNSVVIAWQEKEIRIHAIGDGDFCLKRGWYCPEFGNKQDAVILEWTAENSLPMLTGWCLTFGEHWRDLHCSVNEENRITMANGESESHWKLP